MSLTPQYYRRGHSKQPAATPAFTRLPLPSYIPTAVLAQILAAVSARVSAQQALDYAKAHSGYVTTYGGLTNNFKRAADATTSRGGHGSRRSPKAAQPLHKRQSTGNLTASCLDSAVNDTVINSMFYHGGREFTDAIRDLRCD